MPGNAGTLKFATNINVNILNFRKVLKLIRSHKIDLVIVGPEEPLVKGIVDFLIKNKVQVFGPKKYAAQLEGSKAFMKKLCLKNHIPTAKFKIFVAVISFSTNVTLFAPLDIHSIPNDPIPEYKSKTFEFFIFTLNKFE